MGNRIVAIDWFETKPEIKSGKLSDIYVTIHTPAFKNKTYIPDKKKRWWQK